MIGLKYFKDESVQSWIFRNLKVSGCINLRSVIGSNGKWHLAPSFAKGCSVDIHSFEDSDLLAFLRRSGLAVKQAGIFDNPVDYLPRVYQVFRKCETISYQDASIPIRFCESCIKASIKKYGFSYFKSSWLYQISCETHFESLVQIKTFTHKQTLAALQVVYSGRKLPQELKEDVNLIEPREAPNIEEPLHHVMPCLLFDFYRWASMWRDDDYLERSYIKFYNRTRLTRKDLTDNEVHYYFSKYPEQYPKQFSEFLSSRAETKEYWFGISQSCSLNEVLLKSNKHNCSKCTRAQDHCPVQPIISKFLIDEDSSAVFTRDNMCDMYLRYAT